MCRLVEARVRGTRAPNAISQPAVLLSPDFPQRTALTDPLLRPMLVQEIHRAMPKAAAAATPPINVVCIELVQGRAPV
jgi:hypothetical protein